MDSGRKNDKPPTYLKLSVPDELVKNLRGSEERRALVMLVQIPKQVLERA